ncbi:cation-transporting P-type ATpase C [Clostridium aceticum]|uniref:Cd(2+)-exporting ATPase n=1 Tax=Clostridium aceticum TaxID=84022 RepID=A0A0D8I9N3_9CLOT|nr:heavy metal translocating P-type ATPase [Clostridium aceticum]AKL96392.1 cation-transporting P-type ATpase C [Clostridium aceticum]KJF26968.1 ATPase P [Clostridium aceticum]
MVWKMKESPLLYCQVIHSLPGRIRLGSRAFRYLGKYTKEIMEYLGNAGCITYSEISIITENVLIYYDKDKASPEDIKKIIESVISSYSLVSFQAERKMKSLTSVDERSLQEEPISKILARITITGAVLASSFFLKGPAVVSANLWKRFLTFPAVSSMIMSIPVFKSGVASFKSSMRPNADTLTSVAVLSSIVAGQDISALTTILLADIAELLTAYTMDRTRNAIRDMLSVGEDFAWRMKKDGERERIRVQEVRPNDSILIYTGEKISIDGVVEEGEAVIDQSSITGEYMPAVKTIGDQVFAGSVLKNGFLRVKAEKVGDQTAVARILHLVEEASYQKSDIQLFADRFSAQFIPFNFGLALMVYLFTKNSTRALNMLVVDYSCGVRLSTATAFSASIYTAARNGVLIKGGNYIEKLAESRTLILDKTGTITEGKPQVASMLPAHPWIETREMMELAAAAEETSSHPLALAILDKVKGSGWNIPQHEEIEVFVARGVQTIVEGHVIRVGNMRFMEENHIDTSSIQEKIFTLMQRQEIIVYVAKDEKIIGIIGIQDKLRENMKKSINRLRLLGMDDMILLTGDLEHQADFISHRMAMDDFESEMLPEDKARKILQLQSRGAKVTMVGDGINDAPALAYADVGIAMGGSKTDIAMESADITIASDNPLLIPETVYLSKKTMSIVKQNFASAIGINTLGLVLGSMGVIPVLWAAVLHNSSTIAVVLNSARLLFYDISKEV